MRDELQRALGAGYRVERELAGGGMARVFVARDTALDRDVVVKVLPPETAGAMSVQRFRREIQLAARLQHAHIVPLLSAGESGGVLYYTMPFVRGETLRERVARVGPLPLAEAVKVMRDLATALAYAHREGVVHRDVKPENVLLTEHDALVADFGVSKAVAAAVRETGGSLTTAGVALGTPAYMALEQGTADPSADHRADLYALGVVAYEMLAGAPPFARPSAQALIAAHVADPPEPVGRRRPAVPPALAALVMRCLAKEPADRPQTADEIVRALDAVATPAEPVAATARGAAPADARRATRRTLGIAAAAAGAVLIGGGAWVATRLRAPPPLVDRTAVAVLPFRVVGGDAALRPMREGIPDLVAATLTGRVHAVDVRTVLSAWRRTGGGADLSRADALALARRVGAGAVIEGSAVVTGGTLVLSGTLIPLTDARERQATARGAPAALPALLDSVVGRLLALDAGEGDERAASLAGVPLEALERYLAGRAHDRAGHYGEAVAAYADAIDRDSTFALAALRLWITATNWAPSPRAREAHHLAARHADRLSARDRLLLGPTDDLDRPRTCLETLRRQEQAVSEAPDVPDLWYLLGESLVHCAPATSVDDAVARGVNAFERVLALDSSYVAAAEHFPASYEILGDTARARQAAERLERADASADSRLLGALLDMDSTAERRALAALERGPVGMATFAAGLTVVYSEGTRAADAERLVARARRAATTSGDRAYADAVARNFALARGQPARAAAIERGRPGGADPAFALLAAALWDADTTLAHDARPVARRAVATPPADTAAGGGWVSLVFAAGVDAAAHGDASETRRAVDALRAVPAPPVEPWAVERARRLATILDAQAAALDRRPDAAARLAAADSMLAEGPGGQYVEGVGNLVVASLWERSGAAPRALAATRRLRDHAEIPFAFSTYLRERARLAAVVGARAEAVRLYRHYLTLRRDAEPTFAPHLATVRDALARLGDGRGDRAVAP